MQTYQLTPGRSIDDVLRDLGALAADDREITLVVPPGSDLLSQVENLSRLRRFVLSQEVKLHAFVSDRVTLGLFRIMGFDVNEATPAMIDAGAPARDLPTEPELTALLLAAEDAAPVLAAPATDFVPAAPEQPELSFAADGDWSLVGAPVAAPDLDDDANGHGWASSAPAPVEYTAPVRYYAPAAPTGGYSAPAYNPPPPPVATNNTGKLKMKVKSAADAASAEAASSLPVQLPAAPAAPTVSRFSPRRWFAAATAPAPTVTEQPDWEPVSSAAPGTTGKLKMKIKTNRSEIDSAAPVAQAAAPSIYVPPPPALPAFREPLDLLDTAHGWDAAPNGAAAGGHSDEAPLSGLDVTLPGWLQGEAAAEPPPVGVTSALDMTLPAWMNEVVVDSGASPTPATPEAEIPAWLHDGNSVAPAASATLDVPSIPAWLRDDLPNAAVAAPTMPEPTAVPDAPLTLPRVTPLPELDHANDETNDVVAALTAGDVREAALTQAGSATLEGRALPPMDIAAMGGVTQSAATKASAARESGLDGRTRALLLFGMALVRLAAAEAQAAAAAARRMGCTDDELRLVIQMAQAIGGGPSERLGRRIVG